MLKHRAALTGAMLLLVNTAFAASPVVNETVAIVDPTTPSQQATVTASGALKVDGSAAGGGTVSIDQTTPGTTNAVQATNWPATVDTNSGNKSASTPRVVIATDQPNLTTPLNTSLSASASGGASFTHVAAGQATTTIKSGAGVLYALVLNSAAAATNVTTLYDNTAGSGTVVGIPAATTATIPTTITFGPYGLAFGTGLTVVTATANGSDMTFVWK